MLVERMVQGLNDEVSRAWAVALTVFRPALGFAHVDLIPGADDPGWPPLTGDVRVAFFVLARAAERDGPRAVPSWNWPPPAGMHVELDDPAVLHAVTVYGPMSINCEVYRERDRVPLCGQLEPRPAPMVLIASGSTLTLNISDTEGELLEQQLWQEMIDVRVEAIGGAILRKRRCGRSAEGSGAEQPWRRAGPPRSSRLLR